ncbi:helix-turn-helix domain-containing protein [Mucilaginibacter sp.]|uniref:AlbA family DNA-binding domain-containing protein n=1 Tax=Mucilaginibacter sp. TaxID=1882438 RepID=UPI0035BC4582
MADLSLSIFGKSLTDLSYADVTNFFTTDHGESNTVEFKAYSPQFGNFNQNIKGIIRAICGLLNSDGGIVVWGAPLGTVDQATNEKKFIGALAPVPDYKEKDWMINKISDSITPLPTGIKVSVLQNSPAENIYIIEVQSSPYKPHQFDNTYFVRLDGQTKPAPHYFIEALFRRITYPNIEGYLKIEKAGLIQNPSRYYLTVRIFLFNFSQLQNEENIKIRLLTVPGVFQSRMGNQDPYNHVQDIGMLHFGLVHNHTDTIILTTQELAQSNNIVRISLTYTGKHSPAKASDYTINLGNIDLGNPANTLPMIVEMKENKLFAERQEQLGTTRESTLQSALGRAPSN